MKEEDELGEACSTHGRREMSLGNLKRREHSEDLGVDGMIIFECTVSFCASHDFHLCCLYSSDISLL